MSITSKPNPTVVSLFAGCGGSSLGYKQAGFDIRLAVEWDTGAANVYRRNFPETNVFEGDIADLTAEEALRAATLEPGELDVLDGSPPCQGFSTAGRRKFSDTRNRLFEEYVRMLEVFRPKMLVMENVSGLRKGKMKLIFAEMTRALSCRELNAWWYGVPQDRRRLIWVGVREDLAAVPGHPEPTVTVPVSAGRALGIDGTQSPISIDTNHYNHAEDWKPIAGVVGVLRTKQKPRIIGVLADSWKRAEPSQNLQKKPSWVGSFHSYRLNPHEISPTMIKSVKHWDWREPRHLTIEECKILQGFPEWFEMYENEYKFLGNSVCPPMAQAIGRHLVTLLEEV
jgi:DNA (cytosine-5)-methyltransferase 1